MAILDRLRLGRRRAATTSDQDTASNASSAGSDSSSQNSLRNLTKSFSWKTRSDNSSQTSISPDDIPDIPKLDPTEEEPVNTLNRPEAGVPSWLKKNKQEDEPVNTLDRPEAGVPSWLKKNKKPKKAKKGANVDPRERPLTLQNLEHQEMLNQFTWTFHNRASLDGRSIVSGISPGASRRPSVDMKADEEGAAQHVEHRPSPLGRQSSWLSPDDAATPRRIAVCSE